MRGLIDVAVPFLTQLDLCLGCRSTNDWQWAPVNKFA